MSTVRRSKAAAEKGVDPQAFTDEISQNFRHLADAMNFSYDDFIRTTEPRHIAFCQAIWKAIAGRQSPKGRENHDQTLRGLVRGPRRGRHGSRASGGTRGQKLAPTGAEVEWVEEPSYFFRLSDWHSLLVEYYQDNPDFITPTSRRNEVVSFVEGG